MSSPPAATPGPGPIRGPEEEALGYGPNFLAVAVPPSAPGEGRVLRELAYTHFPVGLGPSRRLTAWTAVNIDGAGRRDVERAGSERFLDPRLPAVEQSGNELYAGNDLDRGHLVRRRDPVWGEPGVAARADADAFA